MNDCAKELPIVSAMQRRHGARVRRVAVLIGINRIRVDLSLSMKSMEYLSTLKATCNSDV